MCGSLAAIMCVILAVVAMLLRDADGWFPALMTSSDSEVSHTDPFKINQGCLDRWQMAAPTLTIFSAIHTFVWAMLQS